MAANKTLDPTTCTTASEAFKYPLPQVRQFHRTLTSELDEKNARLRTLVGGSYRQLLGTAETILQMRGDIGYVEDKLGRVGKGCGRGVVGGMAAGMAKLQESGRGGKRVSDLEWCARMKVLDMCAVTVGRLMKKGGSGTSDSKEGKGKNLVLAAKVLVLSRLLVKSVDTATPQRNDQEKEAVDEIKKKLKILRRRLEKAVERTLEKIGDNRDDLIQALCAYSLATNYGAKDVLRHFLDVQGQAMTLRFEDEGEKKDEAAGVVRALELYTKTLLDVQALVPRRLSEALAHLKSKPLVKDPSVRELEALRLDVCEKWFGDEILFFMPYIRHDDLEGSNAVLMLRKWAKEASEVMMQGFAKTLNQMPEFKSVVDLRTKILEIWIKEGGKAKGFDPSILLDGFRKVVNERMVELLQSRVSKLRLVSTEIEATLGSWQAGIADKQESLWDETMLEMEIANGAALFKQGVVARTYGRNDSVSRVFRGYQTWRHLVDEIIVVIDQLKKQKWDDDLEDIEDDLSLESRSTLLSTDDPQMLQEHLDSSLETAYKDLHEKLGSLLSTYQDSEQSGQISGYLLRIIRDIRSEIPKNPTLRQFGLSLIPTLHEHLASTSSSDSLEAFLRTIKRKKVAGRALWEGEPELPVQPSPGTFKLLHSLASAMSKSGRDLWSPAAIVTLKRHLSSELSDRWSPALKEQEEAKEIKVNGTSTNGDDKEATSGENSTEDLTIAQVAVDPQVQNDLAIQSLFDVQLLQNAFEVTDTKESSENGLEALEKSLEPQTDLDAASSKRLQLAAKEYWKRTGLLFGLLG
ncbi:uncharacterized protein LY89DRAFT_641469 [Mollisia scopiformis]|uniref:Conserved oligomeric Golgi complex subunit 1 n=1 Tax=Mollisia scopiformis TaxID=149040 RepID=A0A194XIN1_MOLSC|nr:uncharacterized protein LY89DRAFT_641469 [Mollisia scopiformis]KUJ20018.1 hypothetical protein LY89DRAFT_641469 [Mollisia scopiformis]